MQWETFLDLAWAMRRPSYGLVRRLMVERALHFGSGDRPKASDISMLLGILLTIHVIVCISLIAVVLLQRSEGGALGMGGGSTGFMTARGAGDLLTRTTWILGSVFFILSLTLTMLAGRERGASTVVDRVKVEGIDPNSLNAGSQPLHRRRSAARRARAVQPLKSRVIVSPSQKPPRRLTLRLRVRLSARHSALSTAFGESPQGAQRESRLT